MSLPFLYPLPWKRSAGIWKGNTCIKWVNRVQLSKYLTIAFLTTINIALMAIKCYQDWSWNLNIFFWWLYNWPPLDTTWLTTSNNKVLNPMQNRTLMETSTLFTFLFSACHWSSSMFALSKGLLNSFLSCYYVAWQRMIWSIKNFMSSLMRQKHLPRYFPKYNEV